MATHGSESIANCHPFPIAGGKYAVIHNGIINILPTGDNSDTAEFCAKVLCPIARKMRLDSPSVRFLVESTVGSGNKLCVMDGNGAVTIFNEASGHWLNGVWFSNRGYEESLWKVTGRDAFAGDWWQRKEKSFHTGKLTDEEEIEAEIAYYRSTGMNEADATEAALAWEGGFNEV